MYVENKQEDGRAVLVEEMKVNGNQVFSGFQSYPRGNKRAASFFTWISRLSRIMNSNPEELSVRFQIRSDDYNQGPLYSTGPVVLNFGEDG